VEKHYLIKVKYAKGEEIRFVSHLDSMRAIERTIRRANLPMEYSQGFNPRMKISYLTQAIKVGEISDSCEAVFTLTEEVAPEDFKARFNAEAPRGIRVLEATLQ